MSKRIVIISTSPRRNSNSEALANAFAKGAAESGNDIEVISLRGKDMRFCLGCFACQKTGKCVIKDDMNGRLCLTVQIRCLFQTIVFATCTFSPLLRRMKTSFLNEHRVALKDGSSALKRRT